MMVDSKKYPRVTKFLKEHLEMTIDGALLWTEIEIKKIEEVIKYEKQEQETKDRRA